MTSKQQLGSVLRKGASPSASLKVSCVLQQQVHSTAGGTCRHTEQTVPQLPFLPLGCPSLALDVQLALYRKWRPYPSSRKIAAALVPMRHISDDVGELPPKVA